MKNIVKRFAVFAIIGFIIISFSTVAYASHNTKVSQPTPAFYGNVYMFYENAPLLWVLMNGKVEGEGYYEIEAKSVALINKGEVEKIRITIPYQESLIEIYYQEHLYYFYLKPHLLGRNFIMFTFEGG